MVWALSTDFTDMKLWPRTSISLALVIMSVWMLLGISPATAADKYVYPGAIIRASGKISAFGSVNASFRNQSAATGFRVEKLGAGTLLISDKTISRGLVSVAAAGAEKPVKYSRAKDICRRAKFRRLKASVGGHMTCSPNWSVQATLTPNDTFYSQQYAPGLMQLPSAWDTTTGSNAQIAVVIDSGIDYTHPDLVDNMWQNPGEVAGNGTPAIRWTTTVTALTWRVLSARKVTTLAAWLACHGTPRLSPLSFWALVAQEARRTR